MGRVRFVLDTNIFSELSKKEPDRGVLAKFQQHRFVSASCAPVHHELKFGILRMRSARRRKELLAFLDGLLEEGVEVLPYDLEASDIHARDRAAITAKGVAPPYVDAQIAAIAMAHDAAVATRNVDDFRRFPGLRVDNWFET
jgi:tRNA(fMet)-specific endonuclease VapC